MTFNSSTLQCLGTAVPSTLASHGEFDVKKFWRDLPLTFATQTQRSKNNISQSAAPNPGHDWRYCLSSLCSKMNFIKVGFPDPGFPVDPVNVFSVVREPARKIRPHPISLVGFSR
jgi:hypothetical protein